MRTRRLAALAAVALFFLSATPAALAEKHHVVHAGTGPGDSVTMSGEALVPKGEVHEGDMVAIFGDVRVEGEVTGDVVVILGSLEVSGTVDGDAVAIMTRPVIHSTAEIDGDLVSVGRTIEQEPGSRVEGQVVNLGFLSFIPFSEHGVGWAWLIRLFFLVKLAMLAGLFLILLLLAALIPRRLAVIAAVFPSRWVAAFLLGLVSWAAVLVVCFLLAITVIGIPLAVALYCATYVVKWIGLASILYLLGQTAGRNILKRDMTHFASVLGGFAIYAVLCLLPLIGTVFSFTLSALAVGIVLLTRFGVEETVAPVVPPTGAPPPYPPPPAPPVATETA
ncbi:MAG TPA: polymer-forming cytoskeletal protein [Candidatus Polarisedimenticolia bacterium]|nr:polymer-forming cytoskeletal protein [Candidatus Polarisedimenticolia bacterium]